MLYADSDHLAQQPLLNLAMTLEAFRQKPLPALLVKHSWRAATMQSMWSTTEQCARSLVSSQFREVHYLSPRLSPVFPCSDFSCLSTIGVKNFGSFGTFHGHAILQCFPELFVSSRRGRRFPRNPGQNPESFLHFGRQPLWLLKRLKLNEDEFYCLVFQRTVDCSFQLKGGLPIDIPWA